MLTWGLALLAAGCATLPPPTAPAAPVSTVFPPAFVTAPIEDAATQLIAAERQASIDGDLDTLTQLWTDDSRVVDARGTATPEDDMVWPGKAAVLDRYVVAVFPNPPPPLGELTGTRLRVADEGRAVLELGGDRWQFVYLDGRWWLAELTYSLP